MVDFELHSTMGKGGNWVVWIGSYSCDELFNSARPQDIGVYCQVAYYDGSNISLLVYGSDRVDPVCSDTV